MLPSFLRRHWGAEHLPDTLCRQVGLPLDTTLESLNANIWHKATTKDIKGPIALYLKEMVQSRLFLGTDEAAQSALSSGLPFSHVELELLPLSTRARNALGHVGNSRKIAAWLQEATAKDLIQVRGVGVKTFLEIVTLVDIHGEPGKNSVSTVSLQQDLDRARSRFPLKEISALDPRLKALRISRKGSLDEAISTLVSTARTAKRREFVRQMLCEINTNLTVLEAEPFDDALVHLLASCIPKKNFHALMKRLGWDGNGGCSLQEAGFTVGLTRERIRQIESKIKDRCAFVSYFPQLDYALEVLEKVAKDPSVRAEIALRQAQITSGEFMPYGVKVAAEFCGREVRFKTKMGSRQLESEGGDLEKALRRVLGDLGSIANVATVEEIRARLWEKEGVDISIEGTRRLLPASDTIHWLDDEETWFWRVASHGGSRYLNFARKILAVSPIISLDKVREGIFRHHRCAGLSLPRLILARLLETAGLNVQGDTVNCTGQNLAEVISDSENALIEILRGNENVADFEQLLEEWRRTEWATATLGMWLGNAPFIERVAPSVYALRGAAIDPARVAQLSAKRERGSSLLDYGWTRDKAVWIGFEVTSTLLTTAIFYLPAALRRLVGLGPFELFAADHVKVGTLKMNDKGQAWGLGPFISRRGVEIGDVLIITLDRELMSAYVQVNGSELMTQFREGEGQGPRALMEEATMPVAESY